MFEEVAPRIENKKKKKKNKKNNKMSIAI